MPEHNPGKNVASLVRLLAILAFLSGIAIIALGVFGMHNIYSHQVISMAEKEAVLISRLLIDQHRSSLFNQTDTENLRLQIDPTSESWLDLRLREFLHPFDIVKIKVFSPDTRVIYSTDRTIIGEKNPSNKRLQAALRGEVDSHLENKDAIRDMQDESSFDVDVVETYTPIRIDNQILGVFELYVDVTKFRQEILEGTFKSLILLSSILLIVYITAFAIARTGLKQVAEAEERLRTQAMTDALTGIFNRGELMIRGEEELSRVVRHGAEGGNGELSLIMIDIDHFKKVNDSYGHQGGDEILQQMPERIKHCLRLYDILGRYGGEEFMILLPNADLDSACIVAERIRCCVAEKPFTLSEGSALITISLGISTIRPGQNLDQTIKRADDALYRAKHNGRNRLEKQTS